jgi:hypothetical protein
MACDAAARHHVLRLALPVNIVRTGRCNHRRPLANHDRALEAHHVVDLVDLVTPHSHVFQMQTRLHAVLTWTAAGTCLGQLQKISGVA